MKLRMVLVGFLLLLVFINTALAYDIGQTIPVSSVTISNCIYNPMEIYTPPCNVSSPQYQPYTTWYSATIVYTGLQEKSQIRHAPIISEQWKIYANKSLVYTGEVSTYTIGTTIVNSTLSNSRIPCGPNMCDLVLLGNTLVPPVINPNPTVTDTLGNSDISRESNIRDPGFSENTSVSSIPGTIEPINTPLPITDNPIQVDHLNTPEIVIAGTPIPTDDSVPTPTIDYTQMVTVGGYAKINDVPQDTDVNKKQDTVVEKDIVEKIKALCTNILSWVGTIELLKIL